MVTMVVVSQAAWQTTTTVTSASAFSPHSTIRDWYLNERHIQSVG